MKRVIVLLSLLSAGCGATKNAVLAPAAEGVLAPARTDIETAWRAIEADAAAMGLMVAPTRLSAGGLVRTCEAPSGPSCGEICKLADSICENAKRICDLAGDDAWATGKCTDAKDICGRADERCCQC